MQAASKQKYTIQTFEINKKEDYDDDDENNVPIYSKYIQFLYPSIQYIFFLYNEEEE